MTYTKTQAEIREKMRDVLSTLDSAARETTTGKELDSFLAAWADLNNAACEAYGMRSVQNLGTSEQGMRK